MKQTAFRTIAFTFLVLVSFGVAKTSFADQPEHFTVTGVTDAQVAEAKHKIGLIQTDPGYYYSGAKGAQHRKEDVAYQRTIIETHDRMPASTK
jgi:hypothetical protein